MQPSRMNISSSSDGMVPCVNGRCLSTGRAGAGGMGDKQTRRDRAEGARCVMGLLRKAWMVALASVLGVGAAAAQPPLIYEGRLLLDDAVPDPWPALRFSLVDGAGMVHWETVVPPDEPIVDEEGRFVAVIESPVDQPYAAAALGEERRLQVEVCAPRPGQPCVWVALGPPQVVGAAPESARLIVDDVVLHVRPVNQPPLPNTFPSVQAALASLRGRMIMPGARVTIQVAPGSYPPAGEPGYPEGIVIDRPDGGGIHIVGVPEAPQTVQLRFAGTTGLTVQTGARLGGLSGVTLAGDGQGDDIFGLYVTTGALATVGPAVRVEGFSGTCAMVVAGQLEAEGLVVSSCGYDGLRAFSAASVQCTACVFENNRNVGLGSTHHSVVACQDCVVRENRYGLLAADHAYLRVIGARSSFSDNRDLLVARFLSEIRLTDLQPEGARVVDDTSLVVH
ncbi:MAG: hypothetical protein H6701_05325 [Myxococcales bacterium]|nr:hypothetical protein [Myxococcales bacterium]